MKTILLDIMLSLTPRSKVECALWVSTALSLGLVTLIAGDPESRGHRCFLLRAASIVRGAAYNAAFAILFVVFFVRRLSSVEATVYGSYIACLVVIFISSSCQSWAGGQVQGKLSRPSEAMPEGTVWALPACWH